MQALIETRQEVATTSFVIAVVFGQACMNTGALPLP
jgi:hypothetical protein